MTEFAANGKAKIAKGFEKRVARGKMDQARADAILQRLLLVQKISVQMRFSRRSSFENMEVKKQTFKELQDIVPADVFLQQIHLLYLSQKSVQDLTVQ